MVKAIICVSVEYLCYNNDHINGIPTNLKQQITLFPWQWRHKIYHIVNKFDCWEHFTPSLDVRQNFRVSDPPLKSSETQTI